MTPAHLAFSLFIASLYILLAFGSLQVFFLTSYSPPKRTCNPLEHVRSRLPNPIMAPQILEQDISDLTVEKHDAETGRGLYATTDIPACMTIVSIQRPLVISLDVPRLKDTCYFCLGYDDDVKDYPKMPIREGDTRLQICAGCHVVRYCSKDCQTWSWKTVHKHECSLFARLHPNILPNNVRAIVQLLLLRKASRLPPGEWDDFMKLESHLPRWKSEGGQMWENIGLMARGAKEYSGTDLDEETLRETFAKLLVNCFVMISPYYDPLGLVLHPLSALVNHSCNYNATVRFDRSKGGHCLSIRALRHIARGEQIFLSYIDATNPRHVRQKELQERYFFDCKCSKCSKEGAVSNPLTLHPHLKVEQRAFELLAAAQKDTSISGAVEKLQYGIHMLKKTCSWPLHRQPLASLRQQLVVSLIAAGQLHLAFLHAWIQYRSIDHKLMPEEHHPVRLVHQWLIVALIKRIEFLRCSPGDHAIQKYDIFERSINLWTILYHVLDKLYRTIKDDQPCGTFAAMVRYTHHHHLGNGLLGNIRATKSHFLKEVEKLRVCATELLEQELVSGDPTSPA